MAQSRISSNSVDWKDVAGNLVAFEAINGVRLEVRISTADHHGRADVAVAVIAHDARKEIGEVPPWASVSVRCSAIRLKTLEGVIIHALYLMDAQLASTELLGKPE